MYKKIFKISVTRVVHITCWEAEKMGGRRKLQNEEIHNLHISLQTIIIKYTVFS
jgi:hypothetical protein